MFSTRNNRSRPTRPRHEFKGLPRPRYDYCERCEGSARPMSNYYLEDMSDGRLPHILNVILKDDIPVISVSVLLLFLVLLILVDMNCLIALWITVQRTMPKLYIFYLLSVRIYVVCKRCINSGKVGQNWNFDEISGTVAELMLRTLRIRVQSSIYIYDISCSAVCSSAVEIVNIRLNAVGKLIDTATVSDNLFAINEHQQWSNCHLRRFQLR